MNGPVSFVKALQAGLNASSGHIWPPGLRLPTSVLTHPTVVTPCARSSEKTAFQQRIQPVGEILEDTAFHEWGRRIRPLRPLRAQFSQTRSDSKCLISFLTDDEPLTERPFSRSAERQMSWLGHWDLALRWTPLPQIKLPPRNTDLLTCMWNVVGCFAWTAVSRRAASMNKAPKTVWICRFSGFNVQEKSVRLMFSGVLMKV